MNKFELMLNQSASSIRGQRAILVGKSAKKAQEALLRELDDKLDKIEEDLLATTDIYPTSELTLLVTSDKFDATIWTKKLQALKVEKANLLVEVELAKETYDEFFGTELEAPAPKGKKAPRGKGTANTEAEA